MVDCKYTKYICVFPRTWIAQGVIEGSSGDST